MKFVALVSGGKDSCFNIIHCLKQGHELVALANLYPLTDDDSPQNDEIDSWMYQTVGYHAVSKYGEALGVPLYRLPIRGDSKAQQLQYVETRNDETEDLKELLQLVLRNHPDITAVSSGAILSNYQRIRVEHVCEKLQLTSLAYLWQRPQDELLDELTSSGLDIRVIKTAGIGLNKNHLGKSLAELRPVLLKLNDMYGLHLCGEGGEYETLVLDGPIFKKKLNIIESKIIDHSADDVSYMSLRVELEDKSEIELTDFSLSTPPLLEERFLEIYENAKCSSKTVARNALVSTFTVVASKNHVNARKAVNIEASNSGKSLVEDVDDAFQKLKSAVSYDTIAYISLVLRDMNDFAEINAAYKSQLESIRPPSARACVESNCIEARFQLSAYTMRSTDRDGLHVQSRSYWAPANIGPYSQQASSDRGYSFLAGQIGLIPASMRLADSIMLQSVVALQHLYRVAETTSSDEFGFFVSFVTSQEAGETTAEIFNFITFNKPAGLLIVKISGLPRGAATEWTGIAIDKSYWEREKYDDDTSELVWPVEYVEHESFTLNRMWSTIFGEFAATVALFDRHSQLLDYLQDKNCNESEYSVIYTKNRDARIPEDLEHVPCDDILDERHNSYESACVILEKAKLCKQNQ